MHKKWNSPPDSHPRHCCFRKKKNQFATARVTRASLSAELPKTESTPQIGNSSNFSPFQRQGSGLLPWCGAGAHGSQCVSLSPGTRTAQGVTATVPSSSQSPWLLISPSKAAHSLCPASPGSSWPHLATSGHPQHSWGLPV